MKVIMKNGTITECKFDDAIGKEAFWHTTAHILAQASFPYKRRIAFE